MQIIYVKCSNYQAVQKYYHWQIKCGIPCSSTKKLAWFSDGSKSSGGRSERTENQAMKKWKRAFIPPARETQAGEYEVIVPASPWPCLGWGGCGGFKWLVHNIVNRRQISLLRWQMQVCKACKSHFWISKLHNLGGLGNWSIFISWIFWGKRQLISK